MLWSRNSHCYDLWCNNTCAGLRIETYTTKIIQTALCVADRMSAWSNTCKLQFKCALRCWKLLYDSLKFLHVFFIWCKCWPIVCAWRVHESQCSRGDRVCFRLNQIASFTRELVKHLSENFVVELERLCSLYARHRSLSRCECCISSSLLSDPSSRPAL